MQLEGKRVVVVGLGRSGVAAARWCSSRGARVIGTDASAPERLSAEARELPEVVAGGHAGVPFRECDLVVVSPGVPPLAVLDEAEAAGVPVIGEVELATRFVQVPIACVGGTNGKSTTTLLLAHMLEASGRRVFTGGNLGTPLAEVLPLSDAVELVILEVSSFQMERAPSFRPRVSILLNLSEDHLDRYASFEAYAAAKGNAFVNQGAEDVAVVPEGDAACLEQARRGGGRVVTFGPGGDYEICGRTVTETRSSENFSLEGVDLHGAHNLGNAAAAIAAARGLGATEVGVREGLARFRGLPHRTRFVASVDGIRFYDDSKGTNVGAAVTALLGLEEGRGVLIAGGRDKHGSYEPLAHALARKGRGLVLIGESAPRIRAAVGDRVPVEDAADMSDAVHRAFRLARRGDAVLLSPACSSFDMFQSYADRGDRFTEAVRRLEERP